MPMGNRWVVPREPDETFGEMRMDEEDLPEGYDQQWEGKRKRKRKKKGFIGYP